MFYYNDFWGMNLIWWAVWVIMLFWIFALPYDIPGQRKKKDTALNILQQRYASGAITTEKYMEQREIIEADLAKLK